MAQPERILDVAWDPSASSVFLVQLQVEALDRSGLLSEITRVLSEQHVDILSAAVQTSRDRVAISKFTFEMGEPGHLDHVIKAVRKLNGVFDVYRITGGRPRSGRATASGGTSDEPSEPDEPSESAEAGSHDRSA